jgi:DNA-binding response OmpR family regulator
MESDSEKTILIVEDEESLAALHAHHLQDEYEARVAFTGGEALVELTSEIDLVLLDRRMPGMSGDELLEHIDDWESDCQVIMVTAVDPDMDIIDMPCEGYLTKPVSKEELLTAVEQAFLIDKYEDLVMEYYETRKKYATLSAEFAPGELDDERFEALEDRLDELETEISGTLDEFPDSDLSDAFRGIHQTNDDEGDGGDTADDDDAGETVEDEAADD